MSAWLSALDVAAALRLPAPTAEQVAVIEAPLQPLLVVAGAGSGKTETMAARVVWLVANGLVEPERVLGLTFTRKAAGELAQRVRTRLGALARAGLLPGAAAPEEATVATYHSYAAAVVADHGLRVGVEPRALLVGEAAAWQLAAGVVEAADDLPGVEAAPSTVVAAVLSLTAACSEHLVEPEDVEAHLAAVVGRARALPGRERAEVRKALARLDARRSLLPLVRRYAERKREAGVLDHGDQVAVAARVARTVPAVGQLERARWGVVLLDEYQDTSTAQAALLASLFGGGHPVTAVGDPHQSIYGWRGASAGGLETFPARFARSGGAPAAVVALSTSWRNDVAVLDAANTLAGPLRAASALALPALTARTGAGPGRVLTRWSETAAEEADAVADAVAAAWRAGSGRSVAVLCRARSQFAALEEALRSRDVPVEVVGLGGLLSRPEVVDVVAALRAVADPSRGEALLRLLTGPRWRTGPRDLHALAAWSRQRDPARAARAAGGRSVAASEPVDGASLLDALDDPPPPAWVGPDGYGPSATARARFADLAAVLRDLRVASTALPLPDLVGEVERALRLDVELAARPDVPPAEARAHLDAFTEVAAGFAETAERATLPAFLAWLAAAEAHEHGLAPGEEPGLDPDADDADGAGAEASRSAVQLLTVHAAKGLEWDVVAVPGLVEGAFPARPRTSAAWLSELGALPHPLRGDVASLPVLDWDAATTQEDLERARAAFAEACADHTVAEERRLAYVALTRAREVLLLSGSWWGTGSRPREPSTFLREVVEALRALGAPLEALPAAPVEPDNPALREPERATWPLTPVGPRRQALERAAAAVRAVIEDVEPTGPGLLAEPATPGLPGSPDLPGSPGLPGSGTGNGWDVEVDRLLAERDGARGGGRALVRLPAHLSASRLVELAADPAALALAVRRPVPVQPRATTRRGTRFHTWLEERFRAATLMDLDDLDDLGDADDPGQDGGAAARLDLAALQAHFLASEWAERQPVAVEVDLETPLAGLAVRCRIDAVFPRADGGVDVVDWKTGAVPTGARARSAAVQLAVYRLAWSRRHAMPLERVGAAFYYAASGTTTRPADLLDAAGLEALVTALPTDDRTAW